MASDFYLRYYVGHKGKFGHEFLEFEFRPDGKLRYANNSNYKNDVMIRKEAYVHKSVMEELKRIIDDSEITKEDDALWPPPDRVGRQELEIVIGDEHISFTTSKIGSLIDVNQSKQEHLALHRRIGLQLRATLENITRLRAEGQDFRWYLKLKCGNCGEVSEKWQYLRLMDSAPLKGGRGSATMVQKCKLCSRENSIDIISQTIKPYNAEDSEKFKTIVEFECRGLEPVDFQPQDWNDYDEKTKESVGIYEVTHKFVKC
ncbi:hypothetical protein HGM15179_007061 [Zosterops borbonicus]|uniref:CXXC motif containing zinc binding protein n=3 Tax=Neoaves TaxID=3078114 RepID=A0A8K1GMB3_9PASS|nr:hypothetical protein HGM15179_007061 [Zosterops borbonicus]